MLPQIKRYSLGFLVPSLALAGSLFPYSSAQASSWVRVLTTAEEDIFYVDTASIERNGNYRSFWANIALGKPQPLTNGQTVYSVNYFLTTDCNTKQYQLSYIELFDQNGKSITDLDYGNNLPTGSPSSAGEKASVNFACSR